jgi:hypothetical protein
VINLKASQEIIKPDKKESKTPQGIEEEIPEVETKCEKQQNEETTFRKLQTDRAKPIKTNEMKEMQSKLRSIRSLKSVYSNSSANFTGLLRNKHISSSSKMICQFKPSFIRYNYRRPTSALEFNKESFIKENSNYLSDNFSFIQEKNKFFPDNCINTNNQHNKSINLNTLEITNPYSLNSSKVSAKHSRASADYINIVGIDHAKLSKHPFKKQSNQFDPLLDIKIKEEVKTFEEEINGKLKEYKKLSLNLQNAGSKVKVVTNEKSSNTNITQSKLQENVSQSKNSKNQLNKSSTLNNFNKSISIQGMGSRKNTQQIGNTVNAVKTQKTPFKKPKMNKHSTSSVITTKTAKYNKKLNPSNSNKTNLLTHNKQFTMQTIESNKQKETITSNNTVLSTQRIDNNDFMNNLEKIKEFESILKNNSFLANQGNSNQIKRNKENLFTGNYTSNMTTTSANLYTQQGQKKQQNKQFLNKYKHVFGDVNTQPSNPYITHNSYQTNLLTKEKSFFEGNSLHTGTRKISEVEGDITNLKKKRFVTNTSIVTDSSHILQNLNLGL